MPVLWRYLLGHFFKTALLCLLSLLAILLTMRLDEIAHFAALGAPFSIILWFSIYQIPYILPITLPLASLTASFLLMQRLSTTHELTALRASGFALKDLIAPVLISAALLASFNFWIVSEVATQAHFEANALKNELRAINPLLLLHNKHLMRLKGIYFDALGPSRVGESASSVILAIPNTHHQRLNLLIAGHLRTSSSALIGQKVTLLTAFAPEQEEEFDHLFIENMGESFTEAQDFSQLLQKKVWTINNDYLKMPLLLTRIQEQKKALASAKAKGIDRASIKSLRAQLGSSQSDIARRFSIAFATFSLTLMGAACGMHIGRQRKYSRFYMVIGLTLLYLIAFFVAKGADRNVSLAVVLYTVPHLLIILTSIWALRRISRGLEWL